MNGPPLPALPPHPIVARLLAVMDRKHHWAYPVFTGPGLTRAQLKEHFVHEYQVYVRDFPVLVAGALSQTPPLQSVRGPLAENIYEEQTGGLSGTAAHPELFLRMMSGLGYERGEFDDELATLHPSAQRYRAFLRARSLASPWQAAVALLTVFVEGSVHERSELEGRRVRPEIEALVAAHPLVRHYGCPPAAMTLARAHAAVEGGHRSDAWNGVVAHVPESGAVFDAVVETCEQALSLWLSYRDGVASRMGLTSPSAGP